jgi:squalene-hopene/tetraprenyl-beta-curcumene cyclase
MVPMIDPDRLRRAYLTARQTLLDERTSEGHWIGELSSSALSTATACSALAIAARHAPPDVRARYERLIEAGLQWIYDRQNPDGGWGDTDLSLSNISTTMLVKAATVLAGQESRRRDALQRAEAYIASKGGIPGLRRRYGKDKTFAVPILTNYALAGLCDWSEVSQLPFELACLPQSWYRFARLPVVSYAIPALVAIGQARWFHAKSWNPYSRLVRPFAVERSLTVLQKMQPASGGYLEATPLTSFVVMSLAAIGRHDHPVTQLGLKFILDSVRADGSWPIDTNLATWVTTLSINALGTSGGTEHLTPQLLKWVLSCQHTERHPFTGADPGGWGWSDLSGAVPDADDTPGAMLALVNFLRIAEESRAVEFVRPSVQSEAWLRGLQNSDGGWPTFCRGWGKLPFDRSGTDLTAHALRALRFHGEVFTGPWGEPGPVDEAVARGFRYLAKSERSDGSWLPLWFGNQHRQDDENPLYGTAKVLLAYRDLDRMADDAARRAVDYLLTEQNPDGGWGGCGLGRSQSNNPKSETKAPANVSENVPLTPHPSPLAPSQSSVEETALVVEALLAAYERPKVRNAVDQGLLWLVEKVESGGFRRPSPIGFYFAKLWYYERLYPIIFTVGALRAAVEHLDDRDSPTPAD